MLRTKRKARSLTYNHHGDPPVARYSTGYSTM